MKMDDLDQITPADNSDPLRPQPTSDDEAVWHEPQAASAPTGAAASNPCKGPLRQLFRNLANGLRISLSMKVEPDRLCATPEALALLAVTDLLVNLLVSFLLVGRGGYLAYLALPSFFFHLPLLVLMGFLAGKVLSRPSLVLVIPVALVALSFPIEMCHALVERMVQLHEMGWLEDYLVAPHYYRFFLWWSATALLFLLRLEPAAAPRRRITVLLIFLVLVAPPLWVFPRGDLWVSTAGNESGELHLTEEVLAAQARLLNGQLENLLPGEKGVTDLYFVGLAGDATQDVFLKEVTAAENLFNERFGTSGRSVVLVNNPKAATTLPFATASNLALAVSRVGKVMNRDEDVLFLFLTSHGSAEHQLVVNNPPLELDDLAPAKVSQILKDAGIGWKVVVVSACYAGGFIGPLKDERSLIITAADATHESFGCGFGEKFTWFGEAFVDNALRSTFSFTAAFEAAREIIGQWEKEQGETPSNPQIWVGKRMEQKLPVLERELAERSEGP